MINQFADNVSRGPAPDNILSEQIQLLPPPFPDRVPDGKNFGDVITDVNSTYKPGEKASVSFYGANPRHNMKVKVKPTGSMCNKAMIRMFGYFGYEVIYKENNSI